MAHVGHVPASRLRRGAMAVADATDFHRVALGCAMIHRVARGLKDPLREYSMASIERSSRQGGAGPMRGAPPLAERGRVCSRVPSEAAPERARRHLARCHHWHVAQGRPERIHERSCHARRRRRRCRHQRAAVNSLASSVTAAPARRPPDAAAAAAALS
eukprot:scaffold298900_cov33-Tisochrysis_lutea.AAC.3